ncbi:MAG: amino acid--[acyl-carrier-protein] ligase [Hyphomicrobiales bacterium]|nr:amino acid--[acyl-carrier-protein] ligase [Hyphomicrobiales bacterium]
MNIAFKSPLESRDALDEMARSLLRPLDVDGVHARTATYERVIGAIAGLISREREPGAEILRFPPVMSRRQLERAGYLKSFPHLLGCVSCLHGSESEIRAAVDGAVAEGAWTSTLAPADLVLSPAACYPVYPLAAEQGPVPREGLLFDVACDCFRHEPSKDLDRLQSFRMREYVRIGSPAQIAEFRERWMTRAGKLADRLGLPHCIEQASDPFFGRGGKLMALSQVEQSLKFELLVPVRSTAQPTACMSFNYHRDHFGTTWGLCDRDGATAHTGCVAFGMDRLAVALFATHGIDITRWPAPTREALML